jgi:hypothetical protein
MVHMSDGEHWALHELLDSEVNVAISYSCCQH